ncbi:MAG: PQQ-binding-like beta-propeller repeat protein [Planctomycetes bacterium]|nr:PQQ-binding-like beta-propeller repeat protein [Planctomycetota bacterium]
MFPLLCLCFPIPGLNSETTDWPGWRGSRGDGTGEGSPPIEWSEEKNVRWKAALPGVGLSSPIVWGAQVFVTTAVPTGKKRAGVVSEHFTRPFELEEQEFLVLAFARASGKELWRKRVNQAMPHEPTHPTNSFATPTPVTDGTRVYCSFGSFGLYALTLTGELAWQVDLGDLTNNGHGEGSSPLLYDGSLILLWAHWGNSFLIALDATNGKERWRTPVPAGNNCSTPIIVHVEGRDQVVCAGSRTIACDPRTGQELWSFGEPNGGITSMASPVAIGELVLVPGVDREDLRALVAMPAGEPAEMLWSRRSNDNIPSPLAYDAKFYFLKGDSAQLTVLDSASGEVEYGPERLQGVSEAWASPVIAGGRLYVTGRDGTVEVLALEPEIATLAVNVLPDAFDASPAAAGDELFLRGKSHLYCLAEPDLK